MAASSGRGENSELQNALNGICQKVLQLIAQYEEGKEPEKLDCLVYHVGRLFRMLMLLNDSTNELLEATSKGLALLENLNKLSDGCCGFAVPLTSGRIGRPKYIIAQEQLEYLLSIGLSCPDIADVLGVSLSTVRRRMNEFGLSITALYSNINDYELDTLVREIMQEFPNCGYRLMHGHLLHRGHRVTQAQIRATMHRVDPEGVAIRWNSSIQRRRYMVASPLSLWHLDGNHKLIR